ncbi:MAG: hypothetical protein KDH96_05980 [Candidatus Riesia sp.]|nr:hypothetical protein [Candidatus Riesia sp.]
MTKKVMIIDNNNTYDAKAVGPGKVGVGRKRLEEVMKEIYEVYAEAFEELAK